MNFWDTFRIDDRPGPRYLAICGALADAIRSGRLGPGRRLPSHRMLARMLGVAVGTVSRAYEEALERGLISGEVGRGSFVSYHPPLQLSVVDGSRIPPDCLDLYQNFPVPVPEVENAAWSEALARLQHEAGLSALLGRASWSEVAGRHREAGAAWIRRTGLDPDPRQILDCPGLQAALGAVLAAATRPGDLVLAAALSHPSVKSLAEHHGLKIRGLPLDEQGVELEAFERVCRDESPTLLHYAPTVHSPTTRTLSAERRRELARIAAEHDVLIVEEEAAAFLLPDPPPPIASFAPERTVLIAEVWMALSMGLRTSYVLVPEALERRMAGAVATVSGTTPAPVAEIAAHWIHSGIADRLIEARRIELTTRNAIAREVLGRRSLHSHPCGSHVWLELPEPWRSDLFVLRAEQLGVAVTGAEWFAVGHGAVPDGVRICIGNAVDRRLLRSALERLDGLIDEPVVGSGPAL